MFLNFFYFDNFFGTVSIILLQSYSMKKGKNYVESLLSIVLC